MLNIFAYLIFLILCCEYVIISNSSLLRKENEKNVTCSYRETTYTCNCGFDDEVTGIQPLQGSFNRLEVLNCRKLTVPSEFLFHAKGLRHVTFTNIKKLYLLTSSLSIQNEISHSGLVLEFTNVDVEEMHSHAIEGEIEQIIYTSGTIGTMHAFSIGSTMNPAYLIRFKDVKIDRIEPQTFKKVAVDKLEFINVEFKHNLPSKSFYDLTVGAAFKIQNSTFKSINPRAIVLKDVSQFIFVENQLETLSGEAFEMTIGQSVIIRDNIFGLLDPIAFQALSISRTYTITKSDNMDLNFINNTIRTAKVPRPLIVNSQFDFIPKSLYYLNSFNCGIFNDLREQNFFVINGDSIYFRLNDEENFKTFASLVHTDCIQKSNLAYIIGGGIAAIIVVLLVVSTVIYFVIQKKRKQKLDIVIPEPRTYKETQIVLQIENAGLLKTDL